MADLIPIDHDPFEDENAPRSDLPGWSLEGLRSALTGAGNWWLRGGLFAGPANPLDQLPGPSGQPEMWANRAGPVGVTQSIDPALTRIPGTAPYQQQQQQALDIAQSFGPGAIERVGASLAGRAAGGSITPISDALEAASLPDQLRATHLARDDPQTIPLSGAKQPITPPPHIQTMADVDALANRYADLAQAGQRGIDWYIHSGREILNDAGYPEAADRFAAALAATSPKATVANNATLALNAWNQAMAGDPVLRTGGLGSALAQKYLYSQDPITGEKIGPFLSALGMEWNPDFAHAFVNDVWNMRALEYPHTGTGSSTPAMYNGQPYFSGTPTLGQHNFARVIANRAADILQERTGREWQPQQVQASVWTGIKDRLEGSPAPAPAGPPPVAPFEPSRIASFADALQSRAAQISWESAPGKTAADHMPEYHTASPEDQQAYHDAMRSVFEDANGNDVVARHLGLLTRPSFQGPGVFKGVVTPGSQAQALVGQAPGGFLQGVDPASRDLLDTMTAVKGLLLRQDASPWHMPAYREGLKLPDANMADVNLGRGLTTEEAKHVAGNMAELYNPPEGVDWSFDPIAAPNGFRFLNIPDASGVSNPDFHKMVANALRNSTLEGVDDSRVRPVFADTGYHTNNWNEQPNGEGYLRTISGTGRPDLERRAAEILGALGPKVSQIEDEFADRLGWTPDRSTRVWETLPQIQQHAGALVPSPPRPWATGPGAAPGSRPPFLLPVDHDPFAGAAPPRVDEMGKDRGAEPRDHAQLKLG